MLSQHSWASALLDPETACPSDLTTWNGSDPAQRFGVYRNNVMISLIDALAETFPATRELSGDEPFVALAARFARCSPPSSPVLAFYGVDFPDFVVGESIGSEMPWVVDLARLEWAYVAAFHAADVSAVDPHRLQKCLADPEVLPSLQIQLHPSLRVLRSEFTQVSLWSAFQEGQDPGAIDPHQAEQAWVLRNGLVVEVMRMRQSDCRFVESIRDGLPLGCAAALAEEEGDGFDLAACLGQLLRAQLITGLSFDGVSIHEH